MRFMAICKEHQDFPVHFHWTHLEQTEWFQTFLLQVRKLRAERKRPVSKSKVQSETGPGLGSFQRAFTAYANLCLKKALEVWHSGVMLPSCGQRGTERRVKWLTQVCNGEWWPDLPRCSFHCTAAPSWLLANGYLSRQAKDTSRYFWKVSMPRSSLVFCVLSSSSFKPISFKFKKRIWHHLLSSVDLRW